MRRFREDRRGVTVQIGAILLFGILVLSLATYQAVAVPTQNERVEFNHNQVVQQDMLELRSTFDAVTGPGEPRSVPVDLGTTYPARVLFVNPPPPGGALRTTPARTTTLANVEATNPETRDFLNGSYAADSRTVVYAPSYREYDAAPTTALEGPVAVNRGDNRSVAISGQRLVEGRTVSLVVVRGNLSRAGTRPLTVDPARVSETRRTTVRNASSGPLTVTVPTTLSATQWSRLLADESTVDGVAPAAGDAVTVSLDPDDGPYTLRVGVVDVGSGAPAPAPRYLTTVPDDDGVTVEVRDRFNNPVGNSEARDLRVNVTEGEAVLAQSTVAVDDDGRASFDYAGATGTATLTLDGAGSLGIDDRNASVEVTVTDADLPDDRGGAEINPNTTDGVALVGAEIVGNTNNANAAENPDVDVTFENFDDSRTRNITRARFVFYDTDQGPGGQNSANARTPPGSVRVSDTTLDAANSGGQLREIQPEPITLSPGSETDVRFTFNAANGGTFDVRMGDFFVVTLVFEDGESATYFVAPTGGGGGGGNNNGGSPGNSGNAPGNSGNAPGRN
jgi:hypothetical protein